MFFQERYWRQVIRRVVTVDRLERGSQAALLALNESDSLRRVGKRHRASEALTLTVNAGWEIAPRKGNDVCDGGQCQHDPAGVCIRSVVLEGKKNGKRQCRQLLEKQTRPVQTDSLAHRHDWETSLGGGRKGTKGACKRYHSPP